MSDKALTSITSGWAGVDLDARIAAHVQAWERMKRWTKPPEMETHPFITISREYGCDALPLALQLVETLNAQFQPVVPWVAYDRELLDRVASELHLRREIVESLDGVRRGAMTELFDAVLNRKVDEAVLFRKLAEIVRTLAVHGHSVLVGRGGYLLTQDLKTGLHVRLVAPRAWRIENVARLRKMPHEDAERIVTVGERERARFLQTYFLHDPLRPVLHDLVINNAQFNVAQMTGIVLAALAARFGKTPVGTAPIARQSPEHERSELTCKR